MKRTFADLFAVAPPTWGTRGDPYLWEDMRLHVINHKTSLPVSFNNLVEELHSSFERFTEHSINEREWFYVEKYAHGGMSSGHIEPRGWREGGKILDYILQCFIRIKMIEEQS